MRAPWKRAAALALATCTLSLPTGCKTDVEKSDEAISADLTLATQYLAGGKPDKATETLEKNASKGSPLAQAQAKSLLAQAEVDAADAALRKLAQQETQISAGLISLERIGWQLATNNGSVAGFQAQNPTAMNKPILVALTGTPTARAAFASPPTAKIQFPTRVRISTQVATATSANQ